MQQRAQRYVRRRRAWLGATSDSEEPAAGSHRPTGGASGAESALRGRRRRSPFNERLEATTGLVGFTQEDQAWIDESRAPLSAHVSDVAHDVYRGLLAEPETAVHFANARSAIDREQVAMRQETFEDWLRSVIDDPLDDETTAYLAAVGHAHVRREHAESRIKARYLVSTISRVQTLFTTILVHSYSDPEKLARCAAAWSKRLMIHLDLLLAVYGSTESTAHWY
jgi:Protoglobin